MNNIIEKAINNLCNKDIKDNYHLLIEIAEHLYFKRRKINLDSLIWAIPFLEILNWEATSTRSGVWTYYESSKMDNMLKTKDYLRKNDNNILYIMYSNGIHDYNTASENEIEQWIDESELIDMWIKRDENQDLILNFLKNTISAHKSEII